jgi:hypothetical protein
MGQNRERLAFAVFFLQSGQILLSFRVISQKQYRRFREGPFQIGIADLFP